MERLTKRDNNGRAIAPEFADETYIMQDDNDVFTGYINSPIIDCLAEYEDKIEDGTLVELPCIRQTHNHKGQIVYRVYFLDHYWNAIRYDEFRDEKEAEKRMEELRR